MSVINATPLLAAAGGDYQISRSVRLRSSASAYFNRTPAANGTRTTWTWSGWVKRGSLTSTMALMGYGISGTLDVFGFNSSDQLYYISVDGGGGTTRANYNTTAVFRDSSAWYHIVFAIDTTQATSTNRLKVYVNGVLQTLTVTSAFALNWTTYLNSTVQNNLGFVFDGGNRYFDGYLTEVNFIDGQALTPSSFGETDAITGVWKPKKYAGTYGTNGFYLNFSDNSSNTATTIGKDNSGNGNNWTPNNISVTTGVTYDSMIDVPTLYADGGNGRGNYAVLNPLGVPYISGTPNSGNLQITAGTAFGAPASISVSSGKWYCEWNIIARGSTTNTGNAGVGVGVGIINADGISQMYNPNGNKRIDSVDLASAWGSAVASGQVIGVAVDLDAKQMSVYINGTLQSTQTYTTGGEYTWYTFVRGVATNPSVALNCGQRPFAYTPPTGFKALNTQNLPEPVIKKGNQFFNATTYTGNGTTTGNTQAISNAVNGVSFQPDLVWIKSRSSGTQFHMWNDSVRGTNKLIYSNSSGAEDSLSNVFNSFNSDGFTVAYNSSYSQAVTNLNGSTYVAWQWKANGSAVTNTSGSISSQVNAGTSQGFSVVTYTGNGTAGATVGHGLGVAPKMVIVKSRSVSPSAWSVYTSMTGAGNELLLNSTAASATSANSWNSTAPTSSVFSLGTALSTNQSSATFVAYCFSEVAGFSKFGSYTGNGSADGPFVFCGFRPRFVMIKRTDAGPSNWTIHDTARETSNVQQAVLYPHLSNAEGTQSALDVLSNGFKLRHTTAEQNGSGGTYIFAAFAESPFKNSLAR